MHNRAASGRAHDMRRHPDMSTQPIIIRMQATDNVAIVANEGGLPAGTAQAVTGPASGPRPTSSTPTTRRAPALRARVS